MILESKKNFVAVLNIPSPYRIHLFSILHQELAARGVHLHVHFMAKEHKERPSTWRDPEIPFPHTYWKDYGIRSYHWNPEMVINIIRNAPVDYLLVGSTWDTFTGICLSLFIRRKKGILWTEGNTKTPGQLNGALGWFKRLILRQFEYAAVPGLEGKEYVRLHQHRTPHRMPDTVMLPNLIDERRFRIRAMWSPQEIVNMRNRLAVLKTEHIALTPARLEPAKGLVEFIEKMPDRTLDGWKWVIIGEGSQKQRLEEVIQKRGMGDRVMILKYVPYEEMPLLYAVSDLFILPSVSDPNPLAVIEAMHSGLPLLLSKQVGNFHEALLAGKTGWGFSPFDTREVHLAIKQAFSASSEGLKDYGKAAKIQAEKVWSSERAIKKFVESIGIPVDTEKRGKRVNAFIKNILDLQSD